MTRSSTWLAEHRRDVYSQTGEDGVLEKVLELLPRRDRWCVEFGAWDGMYLTNTRHLIESDGYSAVLIEGDSQKFVDLQRNFAQYPHVVTLERFVGFTGPNTLDRLLEPTPVPPDFDLLSIDIDGNDYHVWEAVKDYRPKVVVIEFNPTIPTEVHFVQPADPSVTQGASLLALVELGKAKGYELVSVLPLNAFFVTRELYALFEIECNAPAILRTDLGAITWLFCGYDGTVFLRGHCKLPWHSLPLREADVQALPPYLRTYPCDYTRWQKIWFQVLLARQQPAQFVRRVVRKLRKMLGL